MTARGEKKIMCFIFAGLVAPASPPFPSCVDFRAGSFPALFGDFAQAAHTECRGFLDKSEKRRVESAEWVSERWVSERKEEANNRKIIIKRRGKGLGCRVHCQKFKR
jgi:hypothetical protein